jgi:hypothetical protein
MTVTDPPSAQAYLISLPTVATAWCSTRFTAALVSLFEFAIVNTAVAVVCETGLKSIDLRCSAANPVTSRSTKKFCLNLAYIDFYSNIFRQSCHRAAARFPTAHARSLSEIPMRTWGTSYAQVHLPARLRHDPAVRNDIHDRHPESCHRSASREAVEHNSGGHPQGD